MNDMCAQGHPQLKVLLEHNLLNIGDALKQNSNIVREVLVEALLLCPLDDNTIVRIQLAERFRRSLQKSRQTTPYRLHTIISECKSGKTDVFSLEGRFFAHGGVRAVAALAAAATDDKDVVKMLKRLPELHLQALLRAIDTLEPHRDFIFIMETVDRKKPPRVSKKKHVPAPRSRRRHFRACHLQNRTGETNEDTAARSPVDSATPDNGSRSVGRDTSKPILRIDQEDPCPLPDEHEQTSTAALRIGSESTAATLPQGKGFTGGPGHLWQGKGKCLHVCWNRN
ncbi:hypothetical protein BJX96DRAFT_56686 [Aspergillus floccosus]